MFTYINVKIIYNLQKKKVNVHNIRYDTGCGMNSHMFTVLKFRGDMETRRT
jgi:hypothetical protein